jgi:hypothetical protein
MRSRNREDRTLSTTETESTETDPSTFVDTRLAAFAPELVPDELRVHLLAVAGHATRSRVWAEKYAEATRRLAEAIDEAVASPGDVSVAVVSGALVDEAAAGRVFSELEAKAPQMPPNLVTETQNRVHQAVAQAKVDVGDLLRPTYLAALDAVYDGKTTEIPVRLPGDVLAQESYSRTRANTDRLFDEVDRFIGDIGNMSIDAILEGGTSVKARLAELATEVEGANEVTKHADAERVAQNV